MRDLYDGEISHFCGKAAQKKWQAAFRHLPPLRFYDSLLR
jgi:hypothetical protein